MSRGGESLFALLVRAHGVAQVLAADLLLECGASVVEAWVLEAIPPTGDRCASEIAHALEVPTSTVTRALRRLEKYGYLTLTKGTFLDSRVLRPALTEFGAGVRKHTLGFEHELDRFLFAELRPVELGALVVGLTRIVAVPRSIAEQPPPPDPPPSDLGTLTYQNFVPRRPAVEQCDEPSLLSAGSSIDPLDIF
jgi:DNA-binding MarR family transcriptional regulator